MRLHAEIFVLLLSMLLPLSAEAGLKEDVTYLSDGVCAGRKTGDRGAVEASWYIMQRLASNGMKPVMKAFVKDGITGHNIICENNGKGSPILIMADFDGLGTIDGVMYPGADANASGVAGLIHLAGLLKDSGRKFIFAATDAGRNGHAGSEALLQLMKGRNLKMVINLDTMGSALAPVKSYYTKYLIVLGGEAYRKGLEKAGEGLGLKLYYNYYGSREFTDMFFSKLGSQAPFVRSGIPAVMFTSGITDNTGKPADTADTLDYELFEQRLTLISNWLSI